MRKKKEKFEEKMSEWNKIERELDQDQHHLDFTILSFCELKIDVKIMTDVKALMNDSEKIVLMIVDAINCKRIFYDINQMMNEAWILFEEFRVDYMLCNDYD